MVFKRRDTPPLWLRFREMLYPRRGWRRALEYLGHRVRRLPDTPHRIGLGFSCGVFASFSPFFGFHILYAAGLAKLLRGNLLASVIGTFVGNPLTFPLIASVSLALGRRILGFGAPGHDSSRVAGAFAHALGELWRNALSLFGRGTADWEQVLVFLRDVIWPYFLGGLLPGFVAAVASYYFTRPIAAAYQTRKRARMLARAHDQMVRAKSRADGSA